MQSVLWAKLLLVAAVARVGSGHGRLMEPPSRASAWRLGWPTPVDYNDNEGFCGGFSHQYEVNGGKCGICGDAWDEEPRPHEAPDGLYATGTIVRQYTQGQVITLTADITSNHRGHFEARICPDPDVEATQTCLDQNLLMLADGSGFKHNISLNTGEHSIQLLLPPSLTCAHCVLQWRYVAGNNWGLCGDGSGALGCGPQEEFRACADVTILPPNPRMRVRLPAVPQPSFQHASEARRPSGAPSHNDRQLTCRAVGTWKLVPGMATWCSNNCLHSPAHCPATHCDCSGLSLHHPQS